MTRKELAPTPNPSNGPAFQPNGFMRPRTALLARGGGGPGCENHGWCWQDISGGYGVSKHWVCPCQGTLLFVVKETERKPSILGNSLKKETKVPSTAISLIVLAIQTLTQPNNEIFFQTNSRLVVPPYANRHDGACHAWSQLPVKRRHSPWLALSNFERAAKHLAILSGKILLLGFHCIVPKGFCS